MDALEGSFSDDTYSFWILLTLVPPPSLHSLSFLYLSH